MSREILRLTTETAYGVYPSGSPADGTVQLIDLPGDNAWTVRANPEKYEIKSSAASNMTTLIGSQSLTVSGKGMTHVRASQAAWLFGMATGIGGGDCKELPSFAADYGVFTEDGTCTPVLDRYLGCKMGSFAIALDNSAQGALMMASFDVIGQKRIAINGSAFPTPALAAYPFAERPFTFQDTVGKVSIGGQVRTDYEAVGIDVKNTLVPFRGEGRWISRLGWRGREVSFTIRQLFKSRADRDDYEAISRKAITVAFDDGTHTLAFDFGAVNIVDSLADDFKLGDWNRQAVTFRNLLDPDAGVDFVASLTTNTPTP